MLGVFDSGFGGLTVLKPIHDRLPNLSTIYLGDNARAPYGTRSHEEIFAFALEGVRELFRRGCPLVILACNTASAQALRQTQQTVLPVEFPDSDATVGASRRVLGVIRPTAEEIVARSSSGHIGVFATPATVASASYVREISNYAPPSSNVRVAQVACPGQLTALIEQGHGDSEEADAIVASCCAELMSADPLIDTILLGCTHYPLVENLFRKHLPPSVAIVTQGAIVADKLADYLAHHPDLAAHLDQTGTRQYLTTKDDAALSDLASRFYGAPVAFETVALTH